MHRLAPSIRVDGANLLLRNKAIAKQIDRQPDPGTVRRRAWDTIPAEDTMVEQVQPTKGCFRMWRAVRPGPLTAIAASMWLCCADPVHAQATSHRVVPIGQVAFTEGPVWHPDGSVYFSDVENNRIMRRDASGTVRIFRIPAGRANGLVFDLEGRLLACEGSREGGNRRVTRTESNGVITVLADRFQGMRFNSPNDITIDTRGFVYFTDPRYGDRSDMELVDAQGNLVEGVYRIDPDGSVAQLLTHEVTRPNGIAVSPDDHYLFVADNANDATGNVRKLWRFELTDDRQVVPGSRTLLFDWGTDRGPDGMAIDERGRLYVTAGLNYPAPPFETAGKFRAAVYIISSSDGHLIDHIPVPIDMVTNCAFGGPDLQTLFITAGHKLWSVQIDTPGHVAWLTRPERDVP
ncbi:MAG: SMP-30/gluconolactonase/LRE family protein [Planctomycetota bacterium]|nr:MAG: SMP-30/gluconolactonase/LRE family protein [Planctomycetota bacterium]